MVSKSADVKKPRGRPPKDSSAKKPTPAKAKPAKKATPAKGKPAKKATAEKKKPIMAIEAIVDARQAKGTTEYCVKWVGFEGPKNNTWQPAPQLEEYNNLGACIKAYEKADKASKKAAPAKAAPAKKATPAKEKATKKATPAKQAPAEDASAKRGRGRPAKESPAPAKEKAAKKATPAKEKAAKKATPAKEKPAKKATPAKEKPAKKATPAKEKPAKKATAEKKKPAKKATPAKKQAEEPAATVGGKRERRPSQKGAGKDDLVKEFMQDVSAKKAAESKKKPKEAPKKKRVRDELDDEDAEASRLIAAALKHFKTPSKVFEAAKSAAKSAESKPKAKREASSKAESTAKKPKTAPKKDASEIHTVKDLLGVRKGKNGGREYNVKWGKGPNTWEPEAHVSDDLIEEYEEKLRSEASANAKFKIGSKVEVLNTDEGFEWSWAAGKIVADGKKDTFNVEFNAFEDSKGKKLVEKNLPRTRIRTAPKAAKKDWAPEVGDKIEVNEDDCWWEATVEKVGKKGELKVMLRVSDEKKSFLLEDTRPCLWEKLN